MFFYVMRSEFFVYKMFLLGITSLVFQLVQSSQNPFHIFSGSFTTLVPEAIPYMSSIPFIYQVNITHPTMMLKNFSHKLPTCPEYVRNQLYGYHEDDGIFRQEQHTSPKFSNQATCKLWHGMDDLYNKTWKIFQTQDDQPFNLPTRSKKALTWIGEFYSWCCDLVTTDQITDFQLNDENLAAHVNSMKELIHQDHSNLLLTETRFNQLSTHLNNSLQKAHATVQAITEHLKTSQNDMATVQQQTILHLYYTYLNNFVNAYYAHYHSILSYCQRKKLPRALISRSVLYTDLESLQNKLQHHDYELAISITDLNQYYQLALTECTIFDSAIVLRLSIPVRQQAIRYSVYKVWALQFLWQTQLCSLISEDILLINNTKTIHSARITELQNSNLVKMDRHYNFATLSDDCMKQLLVSSSLNHLKHMCQFTCEEADNFVRIRRIQEHEYLVSNFQHNSTVICDKQRFEIPLKTMGILWLSLPCDCELISGNLTYIQQSFPCDARHPDQFTMKHLIPHVWTSFKDVTFSNFQLLPLDDDLTKIIDENWNVSFPTLKLQNNISDSVFKEIHLNHNSDLNDNNTWLSTHVTIIWLGLLTAIVLYNLFIQQIKGIIRNRSEQQPTFVIQRHD